MAVDALLLLSHTTMLQCKKRIHCGIIRGIQIAPLHVNMLVHRNNISYVFLPWPVFFSLSEFLDIKVKTVLSCSHIKERRMKVFIALLPFEDFFEKYIHTRSTSAQAMFNYDCTNHDCMLNNDHWLS